MKQNLKAFMYELAVLMEKHDIVSIEAGGDDEVFISAHNKLARMREHEVAFGYSIDAESLRERILQ